MKDRDFREVDAVFDHALGLDGDARLDFLTALRDRDPGLHTRVLRLLELSERAEGIDEAARRAADAELRDGWGSSD